MTPSDILALLFLFALFAVCLVGNGTPKGPKNL